MLDINNYNISLKIYGIRKFLYFHHSGIWLLYPFYEASLLTTIVPYDIINTILDGEILENKITYIPYNILLYKNKIIINNTFKFKLKILYQISNIINKNFNLNYSIYIILKKYYKLSEIDNIKLDNTFKSDGYIITNIYDNNDVYKYKSFKSQTLDLKFNISTLDTYPYFTCIDSNNLYIKFIGSDKYIFNYEEQLDILDFNSISDGSIIELYPMLINNKIVLKFLKIRYDKILPNLDTICINIWNIINEF